MGYALNFFYNYSKDKAVREATTNEIDRGSNGAKPEETEEAVEEGRAAVEGKKPFAVKLKLMTAGLGLSTTTLFIRAIYRTIEVSLLKITAFLLIVVKCWLALEWLDRSHYPHSSILQ